MDVRHLLARAMFCDRSTTWRLQSGIGSNRRDDDCGRSGAAVAHDVPAGHERRARHRIAGPSPRHPQRGAGPGAGSGVADSVDPVRSLHSVVLHPRFADNRTVFLTYVKSKDAQTRTPTTVAIARARFDGKTLSAVKQIFEADAWGGGSSPARAEFGPDGMLYLAVGVRDSRNSSDDASDRIKAQQLDNHAGKVLRLTENGGAPPDKY